MKITKRSFLKENPNDWPSLLGRRKTTKWNFGSSTASFQGRKYQSRCVRLVGNTDPGKAVLESAGLEGKETTVVEHGSGVPLIRGQALKEVGIAVEAEGLSHTPWVAEDDVLLVTLESVAEDRVGVVGHDVAALVHVAGGIGPGGHGVNGLKVNAVLADKAKEAAGRVLLSLEVVGVLAVDLGHGLDGVTTVSLGDIGVLRVAASDPLGKGLLVQGRPDVGTVAGAAVDGLVVRVVDGDLVVDLNSLGFGVIVSALVVELDGKLPLLVLVVVDPGSPVDARGISPEDGEESSNQPAVARAALSGVVKAVHGDSLLAKSEHGDVTNESLVDVLEQAVVHVAPGTVGRAPVATLLSILADELVDGHGQVAV